MGVLTVSAILFDLDETLCSYRRSSAELLEMAFDEVGVNPIFDADSYHEIVERYIDDAESKAKRRARCFADLAEREGYDPELGHEIARRYADLRDHRNVVAFEGCHEILSEFKAEYALGIVTNGEPAIQNPKLDALGVREHVETVVYAGSETPAKPAVDPFEDALNDLETSTEHAVFVGNSLDTDIRGANRAGLTSVWVPLDRNADANPQTQATEPDYRIDRLADLRTRPWL
jgi:putative hydrolase of the HAD superfamily